MSSRRTYSLIVVMALLLSLSLAVVPSGGAAELCKPPQDENMGKWTAIPFPDFPADDDFQDPVFGGLAHNYLENDAVVDPVDPRTIYVTNGIRALRSDDGGCRWTQIFSTQLAAEPSWTADRSLTSVISFIANGRSTSSHQEIVLALETGESVNRLVVSSDRGATWSQPGTLPSSLEIKAIVVAPSDPKKIYVAANRVLLWPHVSEFFRSTDAGQTWSSVSAHSVQDASHSGPPTFDIHVDPNNPDVIWGLREYQEPNGDPLSCNCPYSDPLREVVTSSDGGATWKVVETAPNPALALAAHWDSKGVHLAVSQPLEGNPGIVYRSDDDGHSWTAMPPLPEMTPKGYVSEADKGGPLTGIVTSLRFAASGKTLVATYEASPNGSGDGKRNGEGIYRYSPMAREWRDITPIPAAFCTGNFSDDGCGTDFLRLDADNQKRSAIYVMKRYSLGGHKTAPYLWRYSGSLK